MHTAQSLLDALDKSVDDIVNKYVANFNALKKEKENDQEFLKKILTEVFPGIQRDFAATATHTLHLSIIHKFDDEEKKKLIEGIQKLMPESSRKFYERIDK